MEANKKILTEIKHAVLLADAGADVILFGSRARGDYREESDWDVLVLTDEPAGMEFKKRVIGNILPIELEHAVGITPIIRNRQQWHNIFSITPLFKEIEKDGIVL